MSLSCATASSEWCQPSRCVARRGEKNGDDPSNWDDVAYWLIRNSKRSVYDDPVVKYGFARGTEPVNYVAAILDRFENYKQFVEKEKDAAVEESAGLD